MRRVQQLLFVAGIVFFFTGCSVQQSVKSRDDDLGKINSEDSQPQKKGDTTMTGSVSKVGDKYYLTEPSGKKQELESYTVDLSTLQGKTITVTGQFSGDTLFVGKVQ